VCLIRRPDEWPVQPFLPCWPINSDTNGRGWNIVMAGSPLK
jgi:hypothetical protein